MAKLLTEEQAIDLVFTHLMKGMDPHARMNGSLKLPTKSVVHPRTKQRYVIVGDSEEEDISDLSFEDFRTN